MKLIKTLRNNWKKSIFFSVAAVYGASWAHRKWEDEELRRRFCEAASAFGQESQPSYGRLRHVTVLLNPAAGGNSSRKQFEKNAAPLLHLAGLDVHIVKTEFEGQATGYMDVIDKGSTDAVILVGGSGLVIEAVTGLLRRPDSEDVVDAFPLGIIPTGSRNTFVKSLLSPLLPRSRTMDDVKFMGEAAMAIIRGATKKIDVLKIEANRAPNDGADDVNAESATTSTTTATTTSPKKIYAIAGLEWGMHREVTEVTDKYWYWGRRLKSRVAYIFSTMTFTPWPHTVAARVRYVDHCRGCSNCLEQEMAEKRRKNREALEKRSLFQKIFTGSTSGRTTGNTDAVVDVLEQPAEDLSVVTNPNCGVINETTMEGSQIVAAIDAVQHPDQDAPASCINLYSLPTPTSRWDFISDGWRRWKERTCAMGFEPPSSSPPEMRNFVVDSAAKKVKEFYLEPTSRPDGQEEFMSVDDERFEVMPMHVALIKKRITCFAPA